MNEVKFNSQICTTKEQSQRLLALGLKPETADMVYHNTNSRTEIMRWELKPYPPTLKSTTHLNVDKLNVFKHKNSDGKVMSGEEYFQELYGKDIPAWSLHRLIEMYKSVGDGSLLKFENITYGLLINRIGMAIATGLLPKQYLNE